MDTLNKCNCQLWYNKSKILTNATDITTSVVESRTATTIKKTILTTNNNLNEAATTATTTTANSKNSTITTTTSVNTYGLFCSSNVTTYYSKVISIKKNECNYQKYYH